MSRHTGPDDLEERFIALETRIAYQDKLLLELHEVLLERGRQVDQLEARLLALNKQLEAGAEPHVPNEPPPHY